MAAALAASGVVVGMRQLTGEVRPRMDIDVLLTTQPDTFNLFLQALAALQTDPKLLGYYALAGIHGMPSTTWDDVGKRFNDNFYGYCAHGVLIFPTWHRPYLSLVEQTIYQKMVEIAGKYNPPHRQRYLDAAKLFRLPYLDYFRPRGGSVSFPGVGPGGQTTFPYNFTLPDILNEPKIALRVAPLDEIKYDNDNPLYTYKFSAATGQLPQSDQNQVSRQFNMRQTVRWPQSVTSTTHNLQALSNSLNSGREGRTSHSLDLIHSRPYGNLSSVASDQLAQGDLTFFEKRDTLNGSGSLEGSLHGNYHNLIGGRGHMSTPTLAAFDPVFWFHHVQVDRVWALWQAFHPNEWFPRPSNPSTLAENKKDLLPFYKARTGVGKGTFYNSDDSRTTEAFGYIYDDFVGVKPNDQAALRARVDGKYLWSSRTPTHPAITAPPEDMRPLPVRSTYFFSKPPAAAGGLSARLATAASTVSHLASDAAASASATLSAAHFPAINLHAQHVLGGAAPPPKDTPPTTTTAPTPAAKISPTFDREWYVDSVVKRAAANGPFTIYFFLCTHGELADGDTSAYAHSPFLAGVNHVFAAPRELCDNCGDREAAGQLASDTTPVTPLLLDYLGIEGNGLESLRPEHVKGFLVRYLRWRVVFVSFFSLLFDPFVCALDED
ncbi:hypothetical protein QBC39DRAFT_353383 [Podospora conica]|nr:hypothetical protein QBC39DRAFT_353383 [Schizothecium conicum]